jgi:uncharacterized protein (DUF2236 family)
VEQHSDYRSDPLGRLQRTSLFITTTTYGSSEQAAATVRAVLRVHERVVGTAADGRPYAANDPRLLLWVHVALTDSMLAAYDAFGRSPLSGRGAAGAPFDGDGYVAEMAVIAERLGVPEPPRSRATLAATLEAFRPELSGDAATREVVGFLANPPLPAAARPAYALLHRGALGLLPAWVHPILGTRRSPWPVQVADGVGTAAALAGLRLVLGDRSPGERAALARIERWTAAGHSPFPVIMHNLADHAPTERSSLS